MTRPASDSTLSWVFDDPAPTPPELRDPFEEPESAALAKAAAPATPLRSPASDNRASGDTTEMPSGDLAPGDPASGETYTFRFDVEVMLAERGKCGGKFMKQWKRVLQAQKLSPLVSPKLLPQEARFQLCMSDGAASLVAEREKEIADELMHLRRDSLPVSGEPPRTHPAGWQGVRVWMTFDRHDVEMALAKKPKL